MRMISILVFPVECVDNEGSTLTISEDPKMIGWLVTLDKPARLSFNCSMDLLLNERREL